MPPSPFARKKRSWRHAVRLRRDGITARRKMLKVPYGPAAGGHSLRFAQTHDEQPLAHLHYGRGYTRRDGGSDDENILLWKKVSSNWDHFRDGASLRVRLLFLEALLVRPRKSLSYRLIADHPRADPKRCVAACSGDKFILEMTTFY